MFYLFIYFVGNNSDPIVVYRETVERTGGPFEGKAPNKHNKFYFKVEPLEESVVQLIRDGVLPQGSKPHR